MNTQKTTTIGDAAVDGLIQGLFAGTAMLIFLLAAGLLRGGQPGEILGLFSPGSGGHPLSGTLAHLAVSSVYGAAFAVVFRGLRGSRLAWAAGPGYGLLLIVIANLVLLPGTGLALATLSAADFWGAHLVYGLVLGGLTFRTGS